MYCKSFLFSGSSFLCVSFDLSVFMDAACSHWAEERLGGVRRQSCEMARSPFHGFFFFPFPCVLLGWRNTNWCNNEVSSLGKNLTMQQHKPHILFWGWFFLQGGSWCMWQWEVTSHHCKASCFVCYLFQYINLDIHLLNLFYFTLDKNYKFGMGILHTRFWELWRTPVLLLSVIICSFNLVGFWVDTKMKHPCLLWCL